VIKILMIDGGNKWLGTVQLPCRPLEGDWIQTDAGLFLVLKRARWQTAAAEPQLIISVEQARQ
jgi:hypothetical protein